MRTHDFLALTELLPHHTCVERGLVVPVGCDERINFVSHQWLGYTLADPHGTHLKTMQEIFRRVIAGQPIFRSEEDRLAYLKGVHPANMAHGGGIIEDSGKSEEAFRSSVANGWVWMEYAGCGSNHLGAHRSGPAFRR